MPPAACIALALALCAADWPHWRGPNRDGAANEPSGWDGKSWLAEKPLWKANVGEGCTSPLVVGKRLFTLGWREGKDHVVCLEAATGKRLWASGYTAPKYGRHHAGDEGYYGGPTATPEYDARTGLLYTLGADGALNAWQADTGKKAWGFSLYDRYKVGRRPKVGAGGKQRDYGYTCAPLAHGGWLLVEVGGADGTVMAFDARSGARRWASEFTGHAGHTGAMALLTVDKVPCVAVLALRHLVIIRLDRGHEGKTLASTPWETEFANNIAGPAVAGQSVLVTTGYNVARIARFTVSTKGLKKQWERKAFSKACTPVVHGGHVYWAWQKVRCLDLETGKQLWEGGNFSDPGSCIVTTDGRLVVWGGTGRLALVETAKRSPGEYRELAWRARLAGSHAWPHVALAGGRLFLKGRKGELTALPVRR